MNATGRSSATRRTDEYKEFRVISVEEPLLDGNEKNDLAEGIVRHSAPPYPESAYRATKCAPSKANKV
jgi:hypothetical protein